MSYQPNPNCIHYHGGVCAHPTARRTFWPNLRCLYALADVRIAGCKVQVERSRPTPPAPPPPRGVKP